VVTALAYARDIAARSNDRVAEKFAEQTDRLNRKQFELLGASKNSQKVVREELRQEYMKAMRTLNHDAKFAGMVSNEHISNDLDQMLTWAEQYAKVYS